MISLLSNNDIVFTTSLVLSSPDVSCSSKKKSTKTKSECKSRDLYGPQHDMTRLDGSFTPGSYDVICARGGEAKHHVGNLNFRKRVAQSASDYANASSKMVKSLIVSAVIAWIRAQSPDGGFVKQIGGVWYEVGDEIAREKVGQALREANAGKYKSSMRAKRMRWKKEKRQQQTHRDADTTLKTMLRDHYEAVETKWQTFGSQASDDCMLDIFTKLNSCFLQSLKADDRLQEQIQLLV